MAAIFSRICATLALAILVSGCALTEDTVSLQYSKMPGVAELPSANKLRVEVVANDARVEHQDRVSVKKNGYGMEMAAIRSDRDVVALVRESIEVELQSRGFRTESGGSRVKVEVMKFYNDFKVGFFSGDAVAEVLLNVQVVGMDGRILFSKPVSSTGKNEDVLLANGSNAKTALENGLQVALANLMSDRDFVNAIFASGGRKSPTAKPMS